MIAPASEDDLVRRLNEAERRVAELDHATDRAGDIDRLTAERDAARADAATCRQVAEAAFRVMENGNGTDSILRSLRARLTHPDAERLRAMVLDLCLASEGVALDNRAATVRRRDDAERAILAALGVP